MVYQKTQNRGGLLEKDIYWKAENTLEFRNRRNEIFTIEQNTVFTVSAEYNRRSDDYEAVIRCYGFAPDFTQSVINGSDSPLAVCSEVEQRLSEDEFYALQNDLKKKCTGLKKEWLERKLLKHDRIREFCRKSEMLNTEYKDLEVREYDLKALLGKNGREPTGIEKKINKFIDLSEQVEADTSLRDATKPIWQGVLLVTSMLFLMALGSSPDPNALVVFIMFILMAFSGLNLLVGPKNTAIVFCKICSFPFVIGDFLTGNGRTRIAKEQRLLLEDELKIVNLDMRRNKRDMMGLRKSLDGNFALINDEIFSAGRLMTCDPQREIETRSDEEIKGGCERVAYPVYKDGTQAPSYNGGTVYGGRSSAQTAGSAMPSVKSSYMPELKTEGLGIIDDSASGSDPQARKVISLSKTGRKSGDPVFRKKVDLRKH